MRKWHRNWGRPVKVDKTLDEVSADDYDAIVLPGGQINPDLLRVEPKALKFIKDTFDAKRSSRLPRALASDRDRHRQGTEDDFVQVDQDGRGERRRDVGGRRGRRRRGHHHFAQSG
jgi:hypothetical protein